jgi:outer membrane receptor for ferrienterochelin and colicins
MEFKKNERYFADWRGFRISHTKCIERRIRCYERLSKSTGRGQIASEIAITTNAGYTRVQEFTGGLMNLDANVFYTYFINMVNPEYPNDTALIVYSNSSGGAMAGGVSLNADFSFSFPLKFGVGFTYSRTFEFEKEDDGEVELEIPAHQPPFTAQFYLSYNFPQPQLSIDWTGSVVSPMYLSVMENDFRPEKSKWYSIQNIQLTKKFNKGIELYFASRISSTSFRRTRYLGHLIRLTKM